MKLTFALLEQKIAYSFKNPQLLETALTHKSYFFEHRSQSSAHNEKLEFLGDAVLDLVMSELLMEKFPEDDEGNLSKKRASLVNETLLNQVAVSLEMQNFILLGKGEENSGGKTKPRLLASAYEALIGALFLDGGFEVARQVARLHFTPVVSQFTATDNYNADYKTRLQEQVQALFKEAPLYQVVGESGPAHERSFQVQLSVQGKVWALGEGRSKKQAEQQAAQKALENLEQSQSGGMEVKGE